MRTVAPLLALLLAAAPITTAPIATAQTIAGSPSPVQFDPPPLQHRLPAEPSIALPSPAQQRFTPGSAGPPATAISRLDLPEAPLPQPARLSPQCPCYPPPYYPPNTPPYRNPPSPDLLGIIVIGVLVLSLLIGAAVH